DPTQHPVRACARHAEGTVVNFDLDQDERALQAAIRDLCKGVFPMETVRALETSGGVSAETWQALDDAGVFSLRLPESDGGAGLGMTAAVIVFEQLGCALVPGPLVGTHVTRSHGAPVEKLTLISRGDQMISYLSSSDVVGVLDAEGVWVIRQNEIAAEAIAQPLDPLTPVSRVSSLPQGKNVSDAETAALVRLEATTLTAALLVGIASAETD